MKSGRDQIAFVAPASPLKQTRGPALICWVISSTAVSLGARGWGADERVDRSCSFFLFFTQRSQFVSVQLLGNLTEFRQVLFFYAPMLFFFFLHFYPDQDSSLVFPFIIFACLRMCGDIFLLYRRVSLLFLENEINAANVIQFEVVTARGRWICCFSKFYAISSLPNLRQFFFFSVSHMYFAGLNHMGKNRVRRSCCNMSISISLHKLALLFS